MAPPPDVGRSSINGGRQRTIAAGLEPATVGSEVQRSSIEPRDRREARRRRVRGRCRVSSGHATRRARRRTYARQKKKGCSTQGSHVITHRSTNWACRCLTSQIGRDGVLSPEYGRIRQCAGGDAAPAVVPGPPAALTKCGHVFICNYCIPKFRERKCPKCRSSIETTLRLHKE